MENSIPKSELKKFGICWFEHLNVITGSIPCSPAVSKDHPTTGQGVRGEEEKGLKWKENMDKSWWKNLSRCLLDWWWWECRWAGWCRTPAWPWVRRGRGRRPSCARPSPPSQIGQSYGSRSSCLKEKMGWPLLRKKSCKPVARYRMEVIRVGSLASDGASSTLHSFMILNFCSVEN